MKRIIIGLAASSMLAACGGGEADEGVILGGAVLPQGVYECDAPQMIGGMVMPNPQPATMFGVLGPGRYRGYDGGEGRFELVDHVLTMTSGPLEGVRYQQDPDLETYFQVLDGDEPSGTRCILNDAKDINGAW